IVVGIVLLQQFLLWTRRRDKQGKTPLLSLKVLDSPQERAAVVCLFLVVGLEAMLNFSVPVYIQIVQGESALATAIAMMPFNIALLLVAVLVVRIFNRFPPRIIGRVGFTLCAIGLSWLAWSASNNWDAMRVMVGLVVFGIGQGALITLLFNVLVSSSPKELAGDVGSLRGVTNNLAAGLGTAIAGALLVALLTASVVSRIEDSPVLPDDASELLDLDDVNFVSNDQLGEYLDGMALSDAQVVEAEQVNHEARLEALKMGFGLMALVAMLAILPAGGLPGYDPKEVPGGIGSAAWSATMGTIRKVDPRRTISKYRKHRESQPAMVDTLRKVDLKRTITQLRQDSGDKP
ncbi:MAG TPA: MFS transporter, partial [Thermomicrobiales bacterium]|nr:MFS transporter [Thermomicrobiales bacterium]